MPNDDLDPEINTDVTSDLNDPAIKNALKVVQRNYSEKNRQDDKNRSIQRLFEEGFTVRSPDGTKKINSKMLYQALWRTANRLKPLDFSIHAGGADENIERVVTAGVSTVLDTGGYVSSFRNKMGAGQNLLMYGDAFTMVGTNPDDGPPILFNPLANDNLYVDVYATGMRNQGWGRNVTKAVAVFSYSWSEFVSMFPHMKNKAGVGRIPREFGTEAVQELSRNKFGPNAQDLDDVTEVAYAYDISNKNFCIFAGAACTKILELKKDGYPFVLDDDPYIPILHWMCMPSSEGLYNHGIGDMLYDLAILSQRLLNMELGHLEDNTYPIELVSVAQGEAAKFFNKLQLAHEMRAKGKKGMVVLEREAGDPSGHAVSSQTLLTQSLFNEWQIIFDHIANELKRMGFYIDELNVDPNVKATKILIDEENANSFVKQVMEYNASESKFAIDLTMNFIKQFVKKSDKTPLNLTTNINTPEGPVRADGLTLGMISDELHKRHYFTKINVRSGAVPSNALRSAQVARGLELAQPGSKAFIRFAQEFASIHDLDVKGEDFIPQAPSAGGGTEMQGAETPVAMGTDRLTVNPRSRQQVPVL